MAYNLLTLNREQSYLMPPSLREWLDEGDLAWFILDAVDQMELGEFYAAYRNDGWGACRKPSPAWRKRPRWQPGQYRNTWEQRQMEEAASGKKKRGRKPKVIEFTPTAEIE